jgi:hypothetical protein
VLLSVRGLGFSVVVSSCLWIGMLAFGDVATWAASAPAVSEESAVKVGISSASVGAQVDPDGLATTYYVEYGPSLPYESRTAQLRLGAGESLAGVSTELTGLAAGSTYHFRFVAMNQAGVEQGADVTFATYPDGIGGLPDGRALEMVSPPENHDAQVYVPHPVETFGYDTYLPYQASADGNRVAYESDPTTGGNGISGYEFGNAQLASRNPEGGWTQTPIQPPGHELGGDEAYQAFSPGLSKGIFGSCKLPALAAGAPTPPSGPRIGYNLLYEHDNLSDGWSSLFTSTPPNREPYIVKGETVEGAMRFGTSEASSHLGESFYTCKKTLVYAGASSDFSRLLFEADDSLLEGEGELATELNEDTKHEIKEELDGNDLYVSTAGRVELVNVLPDGKADPHATFGAQGQDFSRVISTDGSRIFWTDLNTGVVYAREDSLRTVAVSEGPASYLTASSDGRYVFYSESEKLYRFDVEHETREQLAGAGASVQGAVGADEDGERLYFVADGDLAPGAISGEPNLYEWHAGSTSFIVTLSGGDAQDWSPALGTREAEVTPDGRAVVFMSVRSLTGYPTEGQQEVYAYESEAGGAAGVFCASCNPTGVPGASGFLAMSWSNTYMARSISSDGGRVFFDSFAALLPQDTDGNADVYEWEREGSGSCRLAAGCLYLLSGGADGSVLVDTSISGNDVFFVTAAQLLPQDGNEAVDIYDARVNGVPVLPTACSGTGCQGPPAPAPPFATPSSVTFNGVGNFPPPSMVPRVKTKKARPPTRNQKLTRALQECRKRHKGKSRTVCEARAHKRYHMIVKTNKSAARKGR